MKPIKFAALAVAATLVSTSAFAATEVIIDFDPTDGFSENDVITGFDLGGGITATVSAEGNTDPGLGEARLYNTDPPVGADPDLEAPFDNVGGVGPDELDPGLVLIIQQSAGGVPNDDGSGGSITFSFNQMVTFMGFDIFDDVDNFSVEGDGQDQVLDGIDIGGNNDYLRIADLNWSVTSLTFDFKNASGAIDRFVFEAPSEVPLPAGAPLLLAGLGAFAWMKRKKS